MEHVYGNRVTFLNAPKPLLHLLQPLVEDAVRKATPLKGMSVHVAEYVTTAEKVETLQMITCFQANTPPEWIKHMMTEADPKLKGCLEDSSCTDLGLEFALPIRNSPERKLMALANMYFALKLDEFFAGSSEETWETRGRDHNGYYEFLDRIVGISIIPSSDAERKKMRCQSYVFGQYKWYKDLQRQGQNVVNNTFFRDTNKVIDFLQTKGFTVTKKAAAGQIVVYHSESVGHYGKVESVNGKEVIVLSKFGPEHFYRHRAPLVNYQYGRMATFLNPPKSAS